MQHEARGADKAITDAIDKHVDNERGQDDDGDYGEAGLLVGTIVSVSRSDFSHLPLFTLRFALHRRWPSASTPIRDGTTA